MAINGVAEERVYYFWVIILYPVFVH